jgi:hypothetical protein
MNFLALRENKYCMNTPLLTTENHPFTKTNVTLINRNIEQKPHENSKNPESHTKARKLRLEKTHKEPRWHVNLNRYENSVE